MSELKQVIDQFRANVQVHEPSLKLGGRQKAPSTFDLAQFEMEREALEARLAQLGQRYVVVQHLPLLLAFLSLLWVVVWFTITAWVLRGHPDLGLILAGEGTFFAGALIIVSLILRYQAKQSDETVANTREDAVRQLLLGSLPDIENATDYVRLVEAAGEIVETNSRHGARANSKASH